MSTCQVTPSIAPNAGISSTPSSGTFIGQVVDIINANTFTNVLVTGGPGSGPFQVQVQSSDATTSGSFTDPTSGLAVFPTNFLSGGLMWVNSGLWASGTPYGPVSAISGSPYFSSGGAWAGGFQCPQRYVRVNLTSGNAFPAEITASIVKQQRTTGSGGGQSQLPGSGAINV